MTKIPSVEERVEGYRTEIGEAVIATYPVDLFPDNKTAKTMRAMAPAIAGIVSHVIERAVEEAEQRGLEKSQAVLDEMMEMARKEERQKWCHQVYKDGNFQDSIPRWERQINTKYADLSEEEKQSDRVQVYPYIKALTADRTALLTELRDSGLLEEREYNIFKEKFNAGHNTLARKIKAHLDELINSTNV